MKYLAVSEHNPSGSVTVSVGGPFWASYTRSKSGQVWRSDKTGLSLGKMSIKKMRKLLSYEDKTLDSKRKKS